MEPVRVLAVDDQEVFLSAARSLIAATPDFEHVGDASSGHEALELVPKLRPDLILLDVRLPDMDGLETARRLAESDHDAVVVLISLDEVPELPARLRSVGAAAFVRKQDLSTRRLADLWAEHSSRRAVRAAPGREPRYRPPPPY
jgi:DNA-binding NarL/FixJ family response regulator